MLSLLQVRRTFAVKSLEDDGYDAKSHGLDGQSVNPHNPHNSTITNSN